MDERGTVKSRLSKLFKSELGFIKSANLAGKMVDKHWMNSHGENVNQKSLSVLVSAASTLKGGIVQDADEISTYLWCHQKVTGKRGMFFAIGTSLQDMMSAHIWYMMKGLTFAKEVGEEAFFTALSSQ